MKTHFFLITLLFVSFSAFAQQNNAPKDVRNSFLKLYPEATDVKWDKEGKEFEISFKLDGKDISIVFDAKGNALETETKIEISQLPGGVEKYVSDNYKGFKISEAAKIIATKGEITFEAEITKAKVKKDLLFDSKGNIDKKDKGNKNEEEEDKD